MQTFPGKSHPLGHTWDENRHNFSVFSDRNLPMTLVVYSQETRVLEIPMYESDHFHHVAISHLPKDFTYTYRIDSHEVFDPYAKELTSSPIWGERTPLLKSYPSHIEPFDWQGTHKPHLPFESLIIYEMHLRGFTASEGGGTYEAFIDKIPYLKYLGVNAVEFLPIHAFDETETPFAFSPTGKILRNYWGYNTLSFFEPKRSYAAKGHSPTKAFKTLVRELHKNGIEVILDVVYNHVSPSSPLFYLSPSSYFLMDHEGEHTNYTGCGNTIKTNHPQSMDLILSSLRYYATEMQVDGFRFDLASIFCRTSGGELLARPPILEAIALDPVLSKIKLIAEAWDAGGLYQVGSFPSNLFAEWNDRYRDHVRQFIKGDSGKKELFIDAMIASKGMYAGKRPPYQSVNFVTCHDGFTMMDLLSYNGKHNEENGEHNQDGADWNNSWNCGVEGLTDNPQVLRLREKQFCNYMTALFLAQGTPMFFMGDEMGQTHFGNNNAYCQDQPWNWFRWDELKKQEPFFLFVQKLIALRKRLPCLQRTSFIKHADLDIYNETILTRPDGSERFVSFQIFEQLFFSFNANNFPLEIHLPSPKEQHVWKMIIYTTNPIKTAIFDEKVAPKISSSITLDPYTCLVALQMPL